MFNPDNKDYPRNEADQPEFASIVITVDSVGNNPELGDDVVQKIVLSTQDLISAISANAAYFGEPALLANPSNARMLVEAGRRENPVFVYTTPREGTIQIITSTATWDMLVQHPLFGRSSNLLACDKLQGLVATVQSDMQQFAGGFAPLLLLDLSDIDEDHADSASSEGGRGGDAESLRDTAEVENV